MFIGHAGLVVIVLGYRIETKKNKQKISENEKVKFKRIASK